MYNTLGIAGFRGFGEALEAGADTATAELLQANSDFHLSPEEYTYWYNYYQSLGQLGAGLATPNEYSSIAADIVRHLAVVTNGNTVMNVAPAQYAESYNWIAQSGLGLLEAQWLEPADYTVAYQQSADLGDTPPAGSPSPTIPAASPGSPPAGGGIGGPIAAGAAGGLGSGLLIMAAIGAFLLFGNKK